MQSLSKRRCRSNSEGLSLIELLIVVTILAILITSGIGMYLKQLSKARDAQRKKDLDRIRTAFAEYYGDYDCFPTGDKLANCESQDMRPYLDKVPCDPLSKRPYYVDTKPGEGCPNKYRVLTTLEMASDPVIAKVHCDGPEGCGTGLEDFNYGVSDGVPVGMGEILSGNDRLNATPTPTPSGLPSNTPTPTSTPTPPGTPTNTPTPTPPGTPTNTPTNTPTPTPTSPGTPTNTPTNTPTPTPNYSYCCVPPRCNVWDGISNCSGGTYQTYAKCVSAANGCSN